MTPDPSGGWDAVADRFMALRSDTGAALVRDWARATLPAGAAILDLGCGDGVPVARALVAAGFATWGVDASPRLVAAHRRHLPGRPVACETVQHGAFFDRRFAGAIAIGLVFLLPAPEQRALLAKVARVLEPGGRFLFSAPRETGRWRDTLTGRPSRALGAAAYAAALAAAGLEAVGSHTDAGGNHHYEAVRR